MAYDALQGRQLPDVPAEAPSSPSAAAVAAGGVLPAAAQQGGAAHSRGPPLSAAEVDAVYARFEVSYFKPSLSLLTETSNQVARACTGLSNNITHA